MAVVYNMKERKHYKTCGKDPIRTFPPCFVYPKPLLAKKKKNSLLLIIEVLTVAKRWHCHSAHLGMHFFICPIGLLMADWLQGVGMSWLLLKKAGPLLAWVTPPTLALTLSTSVECLKNLLLY